MSKILFEDIYSTKGTRMFECERDNIDWAIIKFNALLINNAGHATLNDWYDCLGIERSSIGDQLEFVIVDNKPLQVYWYTGFNDNNELVNRIGLGASFCEYDEDEGGNHLQIPYVKEANNGGKEM